MVWSARTIIRKRSPIIQFARSTPPLLAGYDMLDTDLTTPNYSPVALIRWLSNSFPRSAFTNWMSPYLQITLLTNAATTFLSFCLELELPQWRNRCTPWAGNCCDGVSGKGAFRSNCTYSNGWDGNGVSPKGNHTKGSEVMTVKPLLPFCCNLALSAGFAKKWVTRK